MAKADRPDDSQAVVDRRFVLAVARILDSRPQPPVTTVGTSNDRGDLVMRTIPAARLELAAGLQEGLEAAERRGSRAGAQALRLAVQDLLEMTRELGRDEVSEADRQLAALDLPTLSAMRLRVWQTVPKVLRRGRIRTRLEYYLLVEFLAGAGHRELTEAELTTLQRLVGEYEKRQAS